MHLAQHTYRHFNRFVGYSFMEHDDFIELPINGILDLHYFNPKEVKALVPDYIEACMEKGIYSLRIIHGKGTGTLRRIVHSVLDRHEFVESYSTATDSSSWGATLVELKREGEE